MNRLGNLGPWEEAVEACNRALGINPNDALTWGHKGWALGNLGRWQEALEVRYHPNKVAHLAPEFRALAEQRMKDLNVAYNAIKKLQHDPT